MKHLLITVFTSTSVTATGILLLITGGQVGAAFAAQQGIGPDTPVGGITVAVVLAGIVAGVTFLWQGAKHMIALGKYIAALTDAVDSSKKTAEALERSVERLDELEHRMAALERWRSDTDFILTELQVRAGLRIRPGDADGTA